MQYIINCLTNRRQISTLKHVDLRRSIPL